ncbi:MAG: SDR family NAD(P)-dependent oxidoreductase [Acetobacteraceae bacterium]
MDGTGMAHPGIAQDGIAIIGMAARLPGAADVDAYWRNLLAGVCAIGHLDDAALQDAGYTTQDLADPRLVRAFGLLDGVARFDARFFGYPPARAQGLDPQQRLLLEVAWHAMEHAGYAPGTTDATVGTYLSITQSSYHPAGQGDLADSFFALTSRDKDYAASRIAYKLDLTGPSMMIQSASSGSLAAIHAAVEGLVSGQCDMALAGGCSISLPQGAYRHAPGLMLSPTGTCRAFDAAADGAVPGNGLGIVVLKPVAQALVDGDTIYAVIRGSALNNDGARKSDYLAPSVQGQARVVGEALAVADVDPATVGYIETHGTGTLIGDPIEIRALSQVFRGAEFGAQRCALGSVKPSIGHLHVASGVAGLIKAALAVHHGEIPPSLNFATANPETALADTPFYVNTARSPWPLPGPRRAGVSAFGLGGTNVHIVLEQAPDLPPRGPRGSKIVPLLFSAKTEAGLRRLTAAMADWLRAHPDADLIDAAWTLAAGRQRFEHRCAVLCVDGPTAIAALEHPAAELSGDGPMADAARAWLAGETVDWGTAFAGLDCRRTALPLYPFEPEEHWSEAPKPVVTEVTAEADDPVVATVDTLGWLRDVVAGILRQEAVELDPDVTYEAFGIDSLLVNSITQALQQRFPTLRATALFEYNTLRRLADHLADLGGIPAPAIRRTAGAGGRTSAPMPDGIAVIGLAGRYPGAETLASFWDNLRAGRDSIAEVPADRWDWRDQVDPERKDRSYTRWGGFIADPDKFDPLFFGISPREARLLDPQQRLFLQTAWAAIEDAGYTRATLKASARNADVGVFAGAMHNAYRLLGSDAAAAGHLVQSNHWSIANRISYLFDFGGPSLTVDTACSASLAAVHLACESLRRGECGVALAGGVSLILHPQQPLELSRAGMLSHGPRCSAFGANGDGFVQGEGVGIAVLKPLAAALADGDRIMAVIRGSAMNAGGKTSGYTVPNPRAQAAVVTAAMRQAGVSPDSIGYVECHGTGTSLGDPIEIAGLSEAFGGMGRGGGVCAIGSVKSNIGHLESAAGIAGLTKAVLQLWHRELVPSLHASPPNPRIDFAAGPFRVQETAAPWPAPSATPRRAGVSSFGAGGANVHVVLEEAPPAPATTSSTGPWLVPLSARSHERLRSQAEALRNWLSRHEADVADIAFTLAVGREAMEARAALIVTDRADLLRQLATLPVPQAASPLGVLARDWIDGRPADFATLYHGQVRRRLALPTYPFLRERCWLPETEPAIRPVGAAAGLLGSMIPTLEAEARWSVDILAVAPVLAQHVVAGQPTMPGVASIELARSAALQLGWSGPLRIERLTWLRPLTAEATGVAASFVVRRDTEGMTFELRRGDVVHAAGCLVPGTDASSPFAPLAGTELAGHALYDRLAERGLAYGPAFRTIETYAVDGQAAQATARAADVFPGCALNPGLMDAALQLTAALIDDGSLILPFAVERIDILRPPPAQCRLHARRIDDGRAQDGIVRFDVAVCAPDGTPCLVLHDLAGRARGAATVPPCFVPGWLPQPAEATAPPTHSTLILGAEDSPLRQALAAAMPEARWADTLSGPPAEHVVFICGEEPGTPDRILALVRSIGPSPVSLTMLALCPDGTPTPWVAAAMGVARVAAHEYPAWRVCCVTIDATASAADALADPGDPLGREIAWRGGRRFVRALRPATLTPVRPAFRDGGTYLILGGAGGIGLELAEHLATRHRARVALLGRRAPDCAKQARIDAMGGAVAFFPADACDAASMRGAVAAVRVRFGPILGAVHSAIVMEDHALSGMTDQAFHAALDVKAAGSVNLVTALAGETLDWLALFSSANSFAANAGQANYVAGCAFKDAYAAEAERRLGCPVRVINWGFWGEVGRVADPVYRARLEKRGVRSIATAEGLAAIERMLGSDTSQVLVLKAEDQVLHSLGVVPLGVVAAEVPAAPGVVDESPLADHAALDTLTRQVVAGWFADHSLTEAEVAPRHRKVFAALQALLARAPAGRPADAKAAEAAFVAAHPDMAPHVRLLRRCVDHFDAVLRDAMPATEVLFPDSSMALVEGIYRGDRLTAQCNGAVADAVRAAVADRPGRTVRVLEVGAGTGGTSASVLAALADAGCPVEYVYTDVSRAFALHGERQFGARYPFVRFGVLDLGRDPQAQGYAAHGFDVVIGANVVHVTPDLAATAERLRGLLAEGGALVLYEMTALPDFATATFGLLDGWWAFTDRRLPHGPLLDAPAWSRLLRGAGFAEVALHGLGAGDPATFRHTVIVATLPAARMTAPDPEPSADVSDADLIAAIRTVVAETLQMQPAQLATDRNFADYGADSIISVDLIAALNARFAITLKPTILFSHPTIVRLAAHLAEHQKVRVAAPVAVVAPPAPMAVPPPALASVRTDAAPTPPLRAARAGAWSDDIAIIGMAGRFPGAPDVETFWTNIRDGIDSVRPVPRSRWDHAAVYSPEPGVPGRTNCPAGGFLDDVESFDPLFFNLSPAEATLMDPQQRLFLQEAWHALEDAGYAGPHPAHARCGVFVGTVAGDYDALLRQAGRQPDAQRFMGNAASMLAARIAYRLDLHGPCLSVDTACSSSLVALQLACESLLRGESDMALAGGVAVLTTSEFYVAAANAGMLSPTGRCHTLDATADGFVPGEAAAAVVLKRRADAERDGDRILALVKAAATNQDGTSNGITAPNGAAQTALARDVHQRFGIYPASISYVELHGTGTKLGDPVEMEALRAAFAQRGSGCAVGSVKANIGHALPAAGIAGIIKLVLMLRHGTIPPLALFRLANPLLDLGDGLFQIPTSARPWTVDGARRAAVSSFGFSGTNAHIVLEQAPSVPLRPKPGRPWHLAVLSAQTRPALDRLAQALAAWLERDAGQTSIGDLCGTLARGRSHLAHRRAFVVTSSAGLLAALHSQGTTPEVPEAEAVRADFLANRPVDWAALYPDGAFNRVPLPTYPFERRRCWPVAPVPDDTLPTATSSDDGGGLSLFDAVIRELGAVQ